MSDKGERLGKRVGRVAVLIDRERARADELTAQLEHSRELLQLLYRERDESTQRFNAEVYGQES